MDRYKKNRQALQNLKKPLAIIFDWDNTLVDTWPLIQSAINSTMKHYNREPWSLEKVIDNVHKSMRDYFPEVFGENWQEAGEIYRNFYQQINKSQLQLLPYAEELINKISQKGIIQFIISNKIGTTLRQEAKKLQVDRHFFSLIGAFDANHDKPNKSVIDLALMGSNIDLSKDHLWFIGDTIADVECAYNSGCQPIIFGQANQRISNSIDADVIENGFMDSSVIPIYFNHQELLEVIEKIA